MHPISDDSFQKQVDNTTRALKTFKTIVALDAPGPAVIAMEELVSTTVHRVSFGIFNLEHALIAQSFLRSCSQTTSPSILVQVLS